MLCSRSPKNHVENGANFLSSDDKTEIVTITKETEAKMSDLKNDYSYEGIADGKQQEQGKPNWEEGKSEQDPHAETEEVKNKNTKQWWRSWTFQAF